MTLTSEESITPVLDNAVTDVPLGIPKSIEIDGDVEETPFMMHNWITEPVSRLVQNLLLIEFRLKACSIVAGTYVQNDSLQVSCS